MIPLVWLTFAQLAASSPVSVTAHCDDCGLSNEDVRVLERWLTKGLEQGGHPTASSPAEGSPVLRVWVYMSRGEWQVNVSGLEHMSASLPAEDFHVASLEALHVAESLLMQAEPTPSASSTRLPLEEQPATSGVSPVVATSAAAGARSTGTPGSTQDTAFGPAGSEDAQRDQAFPGQSHPREHAWYFRPRINCGLIFVDTAPRYSLGLGSTLLKNDRFLLSAEFQFADGEPIPSLTVRDYAVRASPSVVLFDGDVVGFELGVWLGAAYHTVQFRDDPASARWQSLLGLPATLWFHSGLASVGLRSYGQLNPALAGLNHLSNEPYQWGLDLVIGAPR